MPPFTPLPPEINPPENPLAELQVRHAERRFERGLSTRPTFPALMFQRTQRIHEVHRRRALDAGVALDYTAADLRRFVMRKLADGCPFCRQPLAAATFAVTHKNPPRRGGTHKFANLLVCCRTCRGVKGPLDTQELQELLLLMRAWPEPVRRVVLARFRNRRRPDKPRLR